MRAGPSAGAAASRGDRARPRIGAVAPKDARANPSAGVARFFALDARFSQKCDAAPLPLREEARGSGRVCTVSGRLRHDSARWPASMSQSAGFPALDAERLAAVRRTRRVSDAECWVAVLQCCSVAGCRVAVLQGAGLRGRWVAGSLGTELLGAGLRVAGFGAAGYSAAAKTKAGQKRFRC